MTFTNKRHFARQHFELTQRKLHIRKQMLFESIEYELPLEEIANKKIIETKFNNSLLYASIFIFVTGLLFLPGSYDIVGIILMSFAILFIIIAFISQTKVITIPTEYNRNIELFFTKANKEEVLLFANSIIQRSNEWLLNKFSKIDQRLPVEPQLSRIEFLRNREVLTEDQFESLKNQSLNRDAEITIGFGRS